MDLAGYGVHFDARTAVANLRAKGMFALLFDHDGHVGADLTGRGFGEHVEIRSRSDAHFDGAGNSAQIPETIRRRITMHDHAAGNAVDFGVAGDTSHVERSARGFCFDTPAHVVDGDLSRLGIRAHVIFYVRDAY